MPAQLAQHVRRSERQPQQLVDERLGRKGREETPILRQKSADGRERDVELLVARGLERP